MAWQKKTSTWGHPSSPVFLLVCLFLHVTISVKIERLLVPRWVRNGTDHVILDCEYSYTVSDVRLVVKWFFKDQLEPVYQWIPGLDKRHVSGILYGRLNMEYTVEPSDRYSRYRALYIIRPTLEISGKYTCVVTSLASQDLRHKEMLVYAPAKNFSISHNKVASTRSDIFCEATGLYPRPEISLSIILPGLQKHTVLQEISKQVKLTNGSYSVLLARRFGEEDLPKAKMILLECEVYIPETNYKVSKEISFYTGLSVVNKAPSRTFSWMYVLCFTVLTLKS